MFCALLVAPFYLIPISMKSDRNFYFFRKSFIFPIYQNFKTSFKSKLLKCRSICFVAYWSPLAFKTNIRKSCRKILIKLFFLEKVLSKFQKFFQIKIVNMHIDRYGSHEYGKIKYLKISQKMRPPSLLENQRRSLKNFWSF